MPTALAIGLLSMLSFGLIHPRIEVTRIMANLIVRNVDDAIANALKIQASQHGISAEAEHRRILAEALLRPKKQSFLEALSQIPDVGTDADFARIQDQPATNPLD
jgi:antitoxin FitA